MYRPLYGWNENAQPSQEYNKVVGFYMNITATKRFVKTEKISQSSKCSAFY